ncbi:MAG: Uma2 family endonuclease [Gemmatimonadetes bacterium]|nr:Uma2 family endonuclease [Gemmatimonadota bacterium]
MGMPAPLQEYYTVADVLALPSDGNRYELAYGKLLVSPSPVYRHQDVLGRLYRVVADYCDRHGCAVSSGRARARELVASRCGVPAADRSGVALC